MRYAASPCGPTGRRALRTEIGSTRSPWHRRRWQGLRLHDLLEIRQRPRQPLVPPDFRLPAEQPPRQADVRLANLGVVGGQRTVDDLAGAADEPVDLLGE